MTMKLRFLSGVNFHERKFPSPWLVYLEKVATSKVFVRDCTMVPPYALLLFGGTLVVRHAERKLVVDGWIKFEADAKVGVLVKRARFHLERLAARGQDRAPPLTTI